jgi:hypothetical protein
LDKKHRDANKNISIPVKMEVLIKKQILKLSGVLAG